MLSNILNTKENESVRFSEKIPIEQTSKKQIYSMQEELRHVLSTRQQRSDLDIHKTPIIYIEQRSEPNDVVAWLKAKQFSKSVIKCLQGFDGEDLFSLSPKRMEELFGTSEGRRLASQIELQKSISGYKTARSTELQVMLARARPKIEA